MKHCFRLTLEYDGSPYSGWQEQANARTVMGDLRQAAESHLKTPTEIMGAGRTDAGVHAAGQVAHLKFEAPRRPDAALLAAELNRRTPHNIAILECVPAPLSFHARHDATARVYTYQIATRKRAFSKPYVWWIKEPLDLGAMRAACAQLAGRHDFGCFRAADPSKPGESTLVEVASASLACDEDLILFRIEASHFLWRMVRRLTGVLVKLGLGEITPRDFARLLSARPHPKLDAAAWTAPAAGLFLTEVKYPPGALTGPPRNRSPRP